MRPRFRDVGLTFGKLEPGERNLLSDVEGVRVGHVTIVSNEPTIVRTGVTVIVPSEEIFEKPLSAACSVLNGFGKSIGLMQIEELGQIETPIVLTNTLSVGYAFQGVVELVKTKKKFRTLNPVVGECNDGFLNDILYPAVKPEHVVEAYEKASEVFELGSVGAGTGTGMVSFGFKGGIGSASRKLKDGHVLSALVLANFGSFDDLTILGKRACEHVKSGVVKKSEGSIVIVLATDVPLDSRQLKRVARHSFLALGMLGSAGHHGSGDVCIAFSTKEGHVRDEKELFDELFRAAVESVYEAICDALFCAETVDGFCGRVEAMPIDWLLNGGR
ncbi:D-aminopeptidase [Pseudothermotoga hypogea DSM 11164 = NBRC 106472]|uniref:D-aminopeptidase n=1 Tax=Pseudothermotoga hypogea DSM 11164 = NBRC 106472 TaxID=1123384 RepID=A0A0X1KQZ8_9THEM|nr:P1 family peptidase [Pseudothermotoga hypogea]AJC73736.1 D-aminopeptidase [Pseudothermotoga hypogea DSM 11164 = NBRC 106472]